MLRRSQPQQPPAHQVQIGQRTGHRQLAPWAESFYATLEWELLDRWPFKTQAEAEGAAATWYGVRALDWKAM